MIFNEIKKAVQSALDFLHPIIDSKEPKTFKGTSAEWSNLTPAEQAAYEVKYITDDSVVLNDVYSTTETKTNKVWIDNKPIYRRVITGTYPASSINTWTSLVTVDHTSVGTVTSIQGTLTVGGSYAITLDLYWESMENNIYAKQDVTAYSGTYVIILEYTKA